MSGGRFGTGGPRPSPGASDVLAPRRRGLAALFAIVGALAAVLVVPALRRHAPGDLSPAHARAGVPCAACHGAASDGVAADACVKCHGPHPSTRAAHRANQARLTCPACHVAHGPAPAVAIATAAWPQGRVARVATTSCTGCHDLARRDDPVRACLSEGAGEASPMSRCLDEHQTAASPLPSVGVCRKQHGPDRYLAWEAALSSLEASANAGTAAPARGATFLSNNPTATTTGAVAAGLGLFAIVAVRRRLRTTGAHSPPPPLAPTARLPVIDATTCLGCRACVDACPFDALAVERFHAVLARPDACCGAGACERACPNGSLTLAPLGREAPGRPRVDARLESLDRPGVFVAGDVTGVPLIRNAIAQGAQVADAVAASRPRRPRGAGAPLDLLVVGSGPAGLSCALRAREHDLSCVVLEQGQLAASIRAFPRAKLVQDAGARLALPAEGPLPFREGTREELMAHWIRVVRKHRIDVREEHRAIRVEPEGEGFVVTARGPDGERGFRAARVVFATGQRGTPRPLPADIADAARGRVLHALSDAAAWEGKSLLVVGLGDSALEAVVALARQPSTRITMAHRGEGFGRGTLRNIEAVKRLVAAGRVRLLVQTRVLRVEAQAVVVEGPAGAESLRVDAVLALLGGEPSRALLEAAGVRFSTVD